MLSLLLAFTCVALLAYANGANDNFKGVATLFGSGVADYRKALNWATAATLAGSIAAIGFTAHLVAAFIDFFVLRKFNIGGTEMSLYAYENDVIRKLGEPRVHFALNCVALGCPILPKKPFTGKRLDAELERETRKFFSEHRNLRVDHANKAVHVSEILDFYAKDFTPAHAPSLIAYINRYVADLIPEDYAVRFGDYDWTIANSRRHDRPAGTALAN